MITWKKEFETGSANLDLQHRLLIDNINNLESQLQNPNPTPEDAVFAAYLVDYLETYTNMHFMIEEKCMDSYRCLAHAENQQQHEKLRAYILNFRKLCKTEGFKSERLKDLHRVLQIWISEHITNIDTQLKPCILKQQALAASAPSTGGGSKTVPD